MGLLDTLVGQEMFLSGLYLDLGVNSGGTLGTVGNAPAGYVTDASDGYLRLGMMADTDGFNTGKATFLNDAMLLGTPVETFSIGYDIGTKQYVNTNSPRDGITQITNGVTSNLSDATTARAGWIGSTTEGLKVNQVMSLTADAKYVQVTITLTNNSGSDMTDLRYMRSIDPDQGPTFSTNNKIIAQGGDTTGGALVAAYATANANPFFFYSQDERADVSIYGFENRDPYAAAAHDTPQAIGYGVNADEAINIDFAIGALKAGQSTTITYYMGITDDLTSTVAAINAAAATPPTTPTNHAPVAVDDTLTVAAGVAGTGNVLTNDTDADKDILHATLKTGPAHGTVTVADDGTYKYTPTAGYSGTDSFTYAVSDGQASDIGTVKITVSPPVNHPPVAVPDTLTVAANSIGTGNVLTNDTDADNDVLHAALKTAAAHGTVTVAEDGTFKYTPTAGYSGSDSFTYTVSDGQASATGTVTLTVIPPVNHPPVAVADSITVAYGTPGAGNVLTNDTDADGDSLQATLKGGAAHGTVILASDGTFKYTPAAGYSGTDSFTYTVSDGQASAVGTVSVTIKASTNHAPVAVADSASTTAGTPVAGNVLTNDTDADGDTLQSTLKGGAAHGTVILADNGAFKYTPTAGYTGSDSFTYTVSDGAASAVGTVTLTVNPSVNHAPVAVADSITVAAGVAGTGNVLTNDTDADNDTLHASLKTTAAHGTVTIADDGTFKYTPTAGYTGSDSFTYTVSDGQASAVGTVSVTVKAPTNHAPVAVDDTLTVATGVAGTGNVLTNDTDADKDVLHATLKSGPAHGTLTLTDAGVYKYTPAVGYSGTDSFTYTVSDGKATDTGVVNITVTPPAGDPLLNRIGTIDASSPLDQTLTGAAYHNTFYVNSAATSGHDVITNFNADDILATTAKLYDGNQDGIILMKNSHLSVDGPGSADGIDFPGVSALRYLGVAADGLFIYADAATRLNGAIEGTVGNDSLTGDVGDKSVQTFLYDTALGISLGTDTISNFGQKDVLVTTSALQDTDGDGIIQFGASQHLALNTAGAAGSIAITDTSGAALTSLELDGSFVEGHVTYYVYSTVGSHAGAGIIP